MGSSKREEPPKLSSIDHSPAISLPSVGIPMEEGARGCPRAPFLSSFLLLSSLSWGRCRLQGKAFFREGWGEVMRSMFWFVSFFFVPLCLEMVVIGAEGLFPVSAYGY